MKTLDYIHLDASAVSNVVASLKTIIGGLPSILYEPSWFPLEYQGTRVSSFFTVNSRRICTTTLPRRLTSWRNVS